MVKKHRYRPFHSTREELAKKSGTSSPPLAFADQAFMTREELRPARVQLELLKPELTLQDHAIEDTVVIFGSARIPWPEEAQQRLTVAEQNVANNPGDDKAQRALRIAQKVAQNSTYLVEAERLATLISEDEKKNYMVVTGSGPSFMEAANKGAHNVNKRSIGLGIILPHEQAANPYVTPELTFQFHYFAIRKMHFLIRARALVAFPGGFGTLDELFESLTLLQTDKIERIPLLLFNKSFWDSCINFEGLVENGTISASDLDFIKFVETADEAWQHICDFYAE